MTADEVRYHSKALVDQRNPYAPPQAQVLEIKKTKCSRDGNVVVVPVGSDLPPRCIECNAAVTTPIKEIKLYWHSPWLYLLAIINIIAYLIVSLIVRRAVKVSPALCEIHSAQRLRRILIVLGLGGGFCAIVTALLGVDESMLFMVIFLFALVLLVVGISVSRKVYAKKITKEYARIRGCKEPFLASLE